MNTQNTNNTNLDPHSPSNITSDNTELASLNASDPNNHNNNNTTPPRTKQLNLKYADVPSASNGQSPSINSIASPSSQQIRYQQRAQSNILTPKQQLAKHQKLASTSVSIYKPNIGQKHQKSYSVNYSTTHSAANNNINSMHIIQPSNDGLAVLNDTNNPSAQSSQSHIPQPTPFDGDTTINTAHLQTPPDAHNIAQPPTASIPQHLLNGSPDIQYNNSDNSKPSRIEVTNHKNIEPLSPYSVPSKSASMGDDHMALNMNMAPPAMQHTQSDESNLTADINSYKPLDSKTLLGSVSIFIIICVVYRVLFFVLCIINFNANLRI